MQEHFLQSIAWEKFQQSLGHTTVRRSGDGWSFLAVVERSGGITRLYCPYGPTVSSPQVLIDAIAALKEEAMHFQAAFLRIQPTGILLDANDEKRYGLRAIAYSQPVATRVIDLTPPLEEIFAGMTQSKRNVCRNYKKKNLIYHVTKDPADIELLLTPLHDIASRNRISVHSDDYIRKQAQAMMPEHASLHYIELDGDVITASLLYEGEEVNYYAHSGTTAKHYKLQANTALIGELIVYSKNQGKKYLDLYGIAPTDDPKHPWAGVSNFKAEFGGSVVHYNATYDIPLKKLPYFSYTVARSLKQKLK
jgi:lipid II:glycine glycyltransferase (peptidoglycan interpeptide bridge formation enzyme)